MRVSHWSWSIPSRSASAVARSVKKRAWIGQPLAGAPAAVVDPEGGHAAERTRAVGQLSGFR